MMINKTCLDKLGEMDVKRIMNGKLPVLCLAYFYLIEICHYAIATDTRIVTTAPVTPVVEGEILSVHCQVWSLQKGQDVSLFRTSEQGQSERIAVIVDGAALIASNTGTVFVAVRQMNDGSVVHFLSILGVTKHDAGEYSCKIDYVAETEEVLPKDSVHINIAYFPSDPDPVCSQNELTPVLAGTEVALSCSSEAAHPQIKIQWTRSDSTDVLRSETVTRNGRVISVLKLTVDVHDSGKIFLCRLSSKAFPQRTESCHVGPLIVIPNTNDPESNLETNDKSADTDTLKGLDVKTNSIADEQAPVTSATDRVRCWKTCSAVSQSVMYWILATASASILALIFLVLGIVMVVKYYQMPNQGDIPKTQYVPALQAGEEIYVEVESRRCDKSVYMSLEKPKQSEHINFSTTGEI